MTILVYLTYFVGMGVCLAAFGEEMSFFNVALLTSIFVLSRTINIVPGNMGVSELICGVSSDVLMNKVIYGVMISVIFRAVDYAIVGSVFLAFAWQRIIMRARDNTGTHQ